MAPRKPAAPSGLSQLKADLKQGTPAGLYIFYGPEDYLRDYYLEQLKGKVLAGGMESFNLHVFQGKDLTLQELTQAAEAMPMMSERSMVLVYDWDLFKNEERRNGLMTLIDDLPEYLCLVFLYDTMEWKGNANTKLGKLIKAKGQIVEFRQQEQSDLNNWLRRRLKQTWGKEIDNPTAEYLTFLCGGLMTNLAGEADKLGAYARGRAVTKQDIDAVCDPVLDARAFQMTDAIGEGNYDRAMSLLGELLRMGEEPIYIMAAVGRQLRQIWSARLALENGRGESYVAQLWGMRSDWQARKLMQSARRYSLPWCREAVSLCQQADWEMKLGRDGSDVLTDLLLSLATRDRGR
ncbi:MAG: DNA polymerase III subunit delta [Clostridiales bacterium]|nr:DNA polymerase III subunit delta [Clostridiales bacterium]